MQRLSARSTRRRDAIQAEREGNYAPAHCVVTEEFSCLTGAIVCLISFLANAGKGTDVFDEQRSGTFFLPLLRLVHTCNVIAYRNAVTLQETDPIRRAEVSSRASRRNSILRASHIGVPSLLREQRAVVTYHAARPHLLRP